MICLIVAEAAIFIIFFVSYVFYMGKSLTSRTPHRCWSCRSSALFASSPAVSQFISRSSPSPEWSRNCAIGLASTVLLGLLFYSLTQGVVSPHP